jgi:hypothetical protein
MTMRGLNQFHPGDKIIIRDHPRWAGKHGTIVRRLTDANGVQRYYVDINYYRHLVLYAWRLVPEKVKTRRMGRGQRKALVEVIKGLKA